jgi:hypothetical protein
VSASLLILIPLTVLALVLLLGFVGCVLDRQGSDPGLFGSPFTQYSSLTIDGAPVSYWPAR